MVKRTRSTFEAITIIADGVQYDIEELLDYGTIDLQSPYNPEEFYYAICFKCYRGDVWVRCKDEAEQFDIVTYVDSII
jgi:hypothetical protein